MKRLLGFLLGLALLLPATFADAAFTVTLRGNANTGTTAAADLATTSFTPSANSRLFACAVGQNDNHGNSPHSWTFSGGSLSWNVLDASTTVEYDGFTDYDVSVACQYADIGGGPASMTVTADPGTGNQYIGLLVFDVTGYDTGAPFPQASVDNGANIASFGDTESATLTLGSAPTNGNLVVGVFGAGSETAGAVSTPSGYTSLASQSQEYAHVSVFYRTDTTTAAITTTDLGQQIGAWGGVAFEMALSGGGGGGDQTFGFRLRLQQ